jgi:ABC-type polysaccharide/polyol phosphate export permease
LTFAIFFTPVFYEVELFGRWAPVLMLNPVAPLLEGLHAVVVERQTPPLAWIGYSFVVSMVVLVSAWSFFKRAEPAFAESI